MDGFRFLLLPELFATPPLIVKVIEDFNELRMMPEGIAGDYKLSHSRKFIVAAGSNMLIVAVGPVHGGFYHQQLFRALNSSGCLPEGVSIAGGGLLDITVCRDGGRASGAVVGVARFYEQSGDYGVYSPLILQRPVREEIKRVLGLKTEFVWQSWT